MKNLDEIIKYHEEMIEAFRKRMNYFKSQKKEEYVSFAKDCIKENEQYVEWLKELKAYRELFESPEEAKRTLEQLMV